MSNIARSAYKLYVGNIAWTVGHRELGEYFSQFGHVNMAKVMFDKTTGLSRNYGFVEFASRKSLDDVANKQNHLLEGQSLQIQPAN